MKGKIISKDITHKRSSFTQSLKLNAREEKKSVENGTSSTYLKLLLFGQTLSASERKLNLRLILQVNLRSKL